MNVAQRNAAVRRVCRIYRSATPAQVAAGLGWYEQMLTVCQAIAAIVVPGQPLASVTTVVGCLAGLSPRCQVTTNIAWTSALIHAARTGQECPRVHTRTMRGQAWRIANGEPWDAVLRGPKVRAFAANIMGDTDAVTVDVWAVRAALGDAAPADGRIGARLYRDMADVYRRAARRVGQSPRDVQAVVWLAVRGVKPADVAFHADAAQRVAA